MKEKCIREKVYKVSPFNVIKVGDPWYFDAISKGTDIGSEKELVVDIKTPHTNRETMVIVREIEISYFSQITNKNEKCRKFVTYIYQVKKDFTMKDEVLEAAKNGAYYPSLVKETRKLRCDTAQFEVMINNKTHNFHTLADGYYGHYTLLKNNNGIVIHFSLNDDATSWDELNNIIKSLFNVKN